MPLRGEIWEVNLDPVIGHEQAKTRPCLVISDDSINEHANLSIVLPISGTELTLPSGKRSPLLVQLPSDQWTGLTKVSYSHAHQIRTVSHQRFTKKLGGLENELMKKVTFSVMKAIEAA